MNWFRKQRIYLDYASAPPVREEALRAMREAEQFIGNPGAIHAEGVDAKKALQGAREQIARLLEVKAREIIFTSGLTEANNLAVVGYALSLERTRRSLAGTHWVVSAIEHTSVLDSFAEVEHMGGSVSHVMPDAGGIVSAEAVGALLRPETVFVSVGWANNEIGTIQPLAKIARVIRTHEKNDKSDLSSKVLLHADAGQAPLYVSTTAHSLGVDLLSLGGNKLYGPHGVGALYLSNRAELVRTLAGGPQERGLRPGTENAALALGMAAAYEAWAEERDAEARRLRTLRDDFARELQRSIPNLVINGDLKEALPHMLNVSIPDIQSEYIVLRLDHAGIAVSTKSACREGEEQDSHVVAALPTGRQDLAESWRARNTLRFSLGRDTTGKDLKRAAAVLCDVLKRRH